MNLFANLYENIRLRTFLNEQVFYYGYLVVFKVYPCRKLKV